MQSGSGKFARPERLYVMKDTAVSVTLHSELSEQLYKNTENENERKTYYSARDMLQLKSLGPLRRGLTTF